MTDTAILGLPAFYVVAALLGAAGQALRGTLGLVKSYRDTAQFAFDYRLFLATLVLGAVSGLIGALVYDLPGVKPSSLSASDLANDRNFILMAVAAGYFGADVIEGVLGRFSPHGGGKK